MKECGKAAGRRLWEPSFSTRYLVGHGIDIGGGSDPLSLYRELFTRIESVKTWDKSDGDAQLMRGEKNESYDFVHSSHCLEHLVEPREGLENWFRILKPGGHMIVTVPDEDLYEQGSFPSLFNPDHNWTFTIHKTASWSPKSVNLVELLLSLGSSAQILKLQLFDSTFRYELPVLDQTLTPVCESAIEFVVRKRTQVEVDAGGRLSGPGQVTREEFLLLTGRRHGRN